MNTKYKNNTQSTKGFTIIEVVLVLAIAGLIFLMVFLALPALQRGQRDTQRKNDLSRINTQISNYQSSNRGDVPRTAAKLTGSGTGFVTKYLKGSGDTAGSEYKDPSSGDPYTFFYDTSTLPSSATPADNQILYRSGTVCGDDGTAVSGSGRQYTLRTKLEGQTAPYCIDNQ